MSDRFKPAEWEPHRATWLAWPSHPQLWGPLLVAARHEFVEFCRAIVAGPAGDDAERLEVLVLDRAGEEEAAKRLDGLPVRFHRARFGDIWLRDTAPLFALESDGRPVAVCFRFNGWGGKYSYAGDDEVAAAIAARAGWPEARVDVVAEGGALEFDGDGTCISTRSCLLDPQRNPGLHARRIESELRAALGVRRVIWLERGLIGDHTDGHVDNLARFCRPGVVLCMESRGTGDPNAGLLDDVARILAASVDAAGRRIELVRLPSPGLVTASSAMPLPASYLNFYISNTAVVVPVFGSAYDQEAVDVIARCFPERRALAVPSRALLAEGGTFHCVTQQEPALAEPHGGGDET